MNPHGMFREGALKDHTYVVTGGGTGLGKAMTKYLMELGANTVITSRRPAVLEQTAAELERETGSKCMPMVCDVRDAEQVQKVVDGVVSSWGVPTGWVNNAAGNFISPTERLSSNAFGTIIDIVLKGSANCTLAIGKEWIKQNKPGTIVNIVTTYAWTGSGYVVPSATAKAGVLAMTRSLAVEWAKYHIRTNAVAPGPFPTKGAWDRLLPGELAEKFDPARRVPVGRVGEHGELANLVAFLLSPFSAYINGEVITIDGGEWLKGAGQFNGLEAVTPEMWDMFEQFIKGSKK